MTGISRIKMVALTLIVTGEHKFSRPQGSKKLSKVEQLLKDIEEIEEKVRTLSSRFTHLV